ncbi:MAG TPA: nitroreductase family protein [Candidatus Marinimicrobia bacterium]|nr:nitroreductase family protein [Candidatus Neomarinimicrobiota bacterium]HRS52438.1 nitroreductase family protein [Candidatus Neomarinimicrobiota bacterium]HRU93199.1 nitroreductase family protein [Candidatus Neomarinimicrobiota bacterium]
MDFSELILKRRSVRKYLPKPVARELIDKCLDAARLAPSACNAQPWYFIVVDDEEMKNQLCSAAFSGIYSSNKFVKNAPVIIVVITEQKSYQAKLGGFFRNLKYALVDIGIAGEHLALQAAELGLGTCWLGWFSESGVRKALRLSRSAKIDIMFCLGYPADSERPKKRRTLDEIRRYID